MKVGTELGCTQVIKPLLATRWLLVLLLLFPASLHAQIIERAEYFFDTDPGAGNGIPLTVPAPGETVTFSASINTVGLSHGRHLLYIRTKISGGSWSLYEPREFFIEMSVGKAEYFIDTDPGVGNGIPLTVPGGVLTFSAPISIVGIAPGRHLLYIRTKSTAGDWSMYEPREFFVHEPVRQGEYFIDTDPGVGNAIPIAVSTVDDFTFNTSIALPMLPNGTHYFFLRIKERGGAWSLYEPTAFIVDSALPIELLSFTAKRNAEGFVDLNWTTVSENENDYFEVERWIKDNERFPNSFVAIGSVDGHGTSAETHHYTFRDFPAPSKSIYYRLKQVDLDDTFVYSPVVAILSDDEDMAVTLFPNPSSSYFTLQINGKGGEAMHVDVVDVSGKHIENHHIINGPLVLGAHWAPGLYLVRVKNSEKVMVVKIAKAQ